MDITTPTLATILTPELAAFADELRAAGFRTYVFRSDVERVAKGGLEACAKHLGFSRTVDGRECFASVSDSGMFGGFTFSMPMKPSRLHGSSMFIGGDETPDFDDLTLANAELYASPTGTNRLVGTQQNDAAWCIGLYTEVTR